MRIESWVTVNMVLLTMFEAVIAAAAAVPPLAAACERPAPAFDRARDPVQQPHNKKYEGMRVPQIAQLRGDADPADTCIELMADEGGSISGMFHTMAEADVREVMRKPWVAIASDGSAMNLNEDGVPHPRSFSTNPRVLGHYVRDKGVLTLEDAVRKMTSLPA